MISHERGAIYPNQGRHANSGLAGDSVAPGFDQCVDMLVEAHVREAYDRIEQIVDGRSRSAELFEEKGSAKPVNQVAASVALHIFLDKESLTDAFYEAPVYNPHPPEEISTDPKKAAAWCIQFSADHFPNMR